MGAGVVERGQLGERGERRRFRDVELARRLPKVHLRRLLHAARAGAQVDLVQVQLQDRVLGEVVLDLHRHARLFQLARERLLAGNLLREDVAGELHGDGGEPLRPAEGEQVRLDGAEDAQEVDPVMRIEALVFGRDERLADRGGNL